MGYDQRGKFHTSKTQTDSCVTPNAWISCWNTRNMHRCTVACTALIWKPPTSSRNRDESPRVSRELTNPFHEKGTAKPRAQKASLLSNVFIFISTD